MKLSFEIRVLAVLAAFSRFPCAMETVALEPKQSSVSEVKVPNSSVAVSNSLPASVDLRPEFVRRGLVQRSQGARGTCSVFSTVESVEFAVAGRMGTGKPLSVEFANWAANEATGRKDDGDFFHNIIRGVKKYGVCPEELMPYAKSYDVNVQPTEAARLEAAKFSNDVVIEFHWLKRWSSKPGLTGEDLQKVKEVLATGYPVSAGSYHSVLFVGYEDDVKLNGGGRLFISDSNLRETEITYHAAMQRFCDMFWVSANSKNAK